MGKSIFVSWACVVKNPVSREKVKEEMESMLDHAKEMAKQDGQQITKHKFSLTRTRAGEIVQILIWKKNILNAEGQT